MAWVYLSVAGLLEIVWASAMKHSEGFTRPWPSVVTLVAMIASVVLLSISMKTLPLGTALLGMDRHRRGRRLHLRHRRSRRAGQCRSHPGRRADRERNRPHEADGQFGLGMRRAG